MDFLISSESRPEFQEWLTDAIDEIFVKDQQASTTMRVFHQSKGTDFFTRDMDIQVYDLLPNILMSSDPPSYEELLDTPSVYDLGNEELKKNIIVYTIVMMRNPRHLPDDEHVSSDDPPRVGIGSATAKGGAKSRVDQYRREDRSTMPLRVKSSIVEGYEIVHIGVLMMMPLDLCEIYVRRAGFLIFETTLTWKLWSVYQPEGQETWQRDQRKMRDVCPWPLDGLDYHGLNTHSPLMEGGCTRVMTMDEVVEAARLAKQKHLEAAKRWRDKNPHAERMKIPEVKKRHQGYARETRRKNREARQGLRPERLEMVLARDKKQSLYEKNDLNPRKIITRQTADAEEAERRIRPYLTLVTANDLEKQRVLTDAAIFRRGRQGTTMMSRARDAEEAERRILPYLDSVTAEDLEEEKVATARGLTFRDRKERAKTSKGSNEESEDQEVELEETDEEW